MMPTTRMFLRVMAEVETQAQAEAQAREAAALLEPLAAVARHRVERYRKIPEYWDVMLYLEPRGPALEVHERILSLAEGGWTRGEAAEDDPARWAVWNPEPGVELLTPRVRWGQMETWEEEDGRTDRPPRGGVSP